RSRTSSAPIWSAATVARSCSPGSSPATAPARPSAASGAAPAEAGALDKRLEAGASRPPVWAPPSGAPHGVLHTGGGRVSRAERDRAVIVCDRLGRDGKWQNLAKRELADILLPEAMLAALNYHKAAITAVVHLGAITSTSETDADAIIANNFVLSHTLWRWCT